MSQIKPSETDRPMRSGVPSDPTQAHVDGVTKKKNHPRSNRKPNWLLKGTGDVLATIQSSEITPSDVAVTSSSGDDLVCSYSWVKDTTPTIYTPGNPPQYVSVQVPLQTSTDSGMHFADQTNFRIPEYPFEVVFRAMESMNPEYRFNDVDVLINRNTLRKLLDFSHKRCKEAFRINLFVVKNTLIVERCEQSARKLVKGPHDALGWGHEFEKAITRPVLGMDDIAGHHRVLRYDLGGVSCAVRFEVDASYEDAGVQGIQEQGSSGNQTGNIQGLTDRLDALQIQAPPANTNSKPSRQIRIIPRGRGISQTAAAEIKSMKSWKSMGPLLPQLWFGRTQNLIRGRHSNGIFQEIRVQNIEEELRRWESEERNQTSLRKMAMILSQLRDIVKNSKDNACVAVCEKTPAQVSPILKVYSPTSGQRKLPLPHDVRKRFWETD